MDYTKMTYNQLRTNFEKGILDPYDLMDVYKQERASAVRQVNVINKSDVPFTSAEKPEFAKVSDITDTDDLLKAMAEVNDFKQSGYYTLKERHKHRDKALNTMKEHGMDFVNNANYSTWGNFMDWFRANNLNKLYGSQDDVVEDFFSENWEELSETPQTEWMELFEEYSEGML